MKLAILTNLDKEISTNTKGGTELFTYLLTKELAKRDEVESIDLYGVGKNYFTDPKIHFIPVIDQSLTEFVEGNKDLQEIAKRRHDIANQLQIILGIKLIQLLKDKTYDLIHDNTLSPSFMSLSGELKSPIISTLHTNFDSPSIIIPYALGEIQKQSHHYFVPISKHQEEYAAAHGVSLKIIKQIYNGLDISEYKYEIDTPQSAPGLWIGRVSRKHDKGLKETLLSTKAAQRPLQVIYSLDDMEFYKEHIEQLMDEHVEVVPQPQTHLDKNVWYSKGSFLIYPIMWEEPFPNVILEAMASGTPIIAFAKGSLPESVEDGKTGFIVNTSEDDIRGSFIIKKTGVEGLQEAIERLQSLSADEYKAMRERCRKRVEDHFKVERMVDDYVQVYKQILQ